jgi:hypothetical protein
MHRTKSFAAGLIAGVALAAATAYAAGLHPWTSGNIEAANALFGDRSGLTFAIPPPDPDRLLVQAHPIAGLAQDIAVQPPPDPETGAVPPGPCFVAHLQPPPDPGRPSIRLEVFHPEQFSIVAPDGTPLALCTASTVPTN